MDISSSSDTSNNRSTSNVLNLPFEVTENVEVINTTKHFFDNLLTLEWEKTETFEEYLHKIHQHENVYFDIKNYDEIALNKLTLKQLMDLKIKIKEHIYNVNLLNEKRNILNGINQARIGLQICRLGAINIHIYMYIYYGKAPT